MSFPPKSNSISPSDDNPNQAYSLPKNYDAATEEPKWQQWWLNNNVNRFDPDDAKRPSYSIDTPPPYPSGEFHVGNALNWCYIDFVARYHRMKGDNVHFPQGWDCHGLPTEVNAEKTLKKRKNEIPAAQFVEVCRKLTEEHIAKMKRTIIRLGVSTDWNLEYKTMDPSYYKRTQLSFILLYKSGLIYRGEHPVNWCPRCETAIAEAEVEHHDRQGSLHYMKFGNGDEIQIASTRPELLVACVAVAVHPDDDRYKRRGRETTVPIFGQEVPIIEDQEVDQKFGTGAVMVCTFGDKTDVRWQKKHKLPVIRAVSENGRLISADTRYNGLKLEEARKRIVEGLKQQGKLAKTEPSQQSIGVCWRCKTPVEIISRPQWFMRTRDMTDQVLEWAEKLHWVPNFSKQRLKDWAQSLDWDWVLSRQRIFATPIPVWYCKDCSHTITATENALPADPRAERAPVTECPKCGSKKIIGETDVLDTWMDSSITAAVHAGWPNKNHRFEQLFPSDLQPNGLDIIRTWDYYLLVRGLALFGKAPYKTLLINGMVRGTDGRMMHKSYGNYVETDEVFRKASADAFRQWVATGGSTGYDIPFKWTEVEYGRKFLTKLWNVARFIIGNSSASNTLHQPESLSVIDRWMLSSTQRVVSEVTTAMEDFQFSIAFEAIRNFVWHTLADDYLEAVKYRLQPGESEKGRAAAQFCLNNALLTITKLISPFCPHISESIYQHLRQTGDPQTVHLTNWPLTQTSFLNDSWIRDGQVIVEAIAVGRRAKSEKGIPLGSPVSKVLVSASSQSMRLLSENRETLLRTLKAQALEQMPQTQEAEQRPIKVDIVA